MIKHPSGALFISWYEIDEVLNEVIPVSQLAQRPQNQDTKILSGRHVRMDNIRYSVFKDSLSCKYCGVTGNMFALETSAIDSPIAHFNLYMKTEYRLTLMTIDHVIPKSRGGSEHFTNFCVACSPCNNKKGSLTGEEFERSLGIKTSEVSTQQELANEPTVFSLEACENNLFVYNGFVWDTKNIQQYYTIALAIATLSSLEVKKLGEKVNAKVNKSAGHSYLAKQFGSPSQVPFYEKEREQWMLVKKLFTSCRDGHEKPYAPINQSIFEEFARMIELQHMIQIKEATLTEVSEPKETLGEETSNDS